MHALKMTLSFPRFLFLVAFFLRAIFVVRRLPSFPGATTLCQLSTLTIKKGIATSTRLTPVRQVDECCHLWSLCWHFAALQMGRSALGGVQSSFPLSALFTLLLLLSPLQPHAHRPERFPRARPAPLLPFWQTAGSTERRDTCLCATVWHAQSPRVCTECGSVC